MKEHIAASSPSLFEEHKRSGSLTEASKKELKTSLVNFLYARTAVPHKEQIVPVCEVVINLFPSLRTKDSTIGGIVSRIVFETFIRLSEFLLENDYNYLLIGSAVRFREQFRFPTTQNKKYAEEEK